MSAQPLSEYGVVDAPAAAAQATANAAVAAAAAAQATADQAVADLATAVAGGPIDRRGYEICEEFTTGLFSSPAFTHGWTRVSSGTTSATSTSEPEHDGILSMTATTIAARLTYHLGGATIDLDPTRKVTGWEFLLRVPTLGDETDQFSCSAGLSDGLGLTGDGANAVQIKYDSTVSLNWIFQWIVAGVPANFNTSFPVVAGQWVAVRFELSSSTGNCFLANLNTPYSGGVGPFGAAAFADIVAGPMIKVEKSAGNVNPRGFDIDFARYYARFPSLR